MQPWVYTTGKRFGRLVIIGRRDGNVVRVRCDCGAQKDVQTVALKHGQMSCGCYRDEQRFTHGLSHTPEYGVWEHIVQRCTNPNNDAYKNYGGRGIQLCTEWRESFAVFFADMGKRPGPGWTIERVNNEEGYTPGNCQWILKGKQVRNRRDTRVLTIDGLSRSIWEWSEVYKIPMSTIRTRLHRGWTDEQAVTYPAQRGKKPV